MSPRSLAVLSLSVCFLLMVANINAFRIRKRMFPRPGRSEELLPRQVFPWLGDRFDIGVMVLPRQGRFDVRAVPACCGMNNPCPLGMNCCPGLQISVHDKVYTCHLAL